MPAHGLNSWKRPPSGAKQAAEKLRFSDKVGEIRPSGAKARAFPALFGTTEVVP
jgi:hypothetical protein